MSKLPITNAIHGARAVSIIRKASAYIRFHVRILLCSSCNTRSLLSVDGNIIFAAPIS